MSFTIAEPLKRTCLSLHYYAKVMGINPVFFSGATAESIGVFPLTNNRNNDLWPRYSWQDADRVSQEDLARVIYDAEQDIMNYLKYPVCPIWIEQDVQMYPRYHRRDIWQVGAFDVRGAMKSVILKYGKVIAPGQRSVSLVGTATVAGGGIVYSDDDSDGFNETATITVPTTLTNECEIKVYFADQDGALEWEIRPARSKEITGGNFVAKFWSWQFIDPDKASVFPTTDDFRAIDIGTDANFVVSVDVYREYNDTSLPSAVFYWEPNPPWTQSSVCGICGVSGCTACSLTTQDGCFHIRNPELGEVVPVPATYDDDTGTWSTSCFTVCRDPDIVKLYYQAGDFSNENLSGRTCEALSNYWAQTIAWLATARLERPMCAGTNIIALQRKWQADMALTGETAYQIQPEDLRNPFGTRYGEVMAWRRLNHLARKRMTGVAV